MSDDLKTKLARMRGEIVAPARTDSEMGRRLSRKLKRPEQVLGADCNAAGLQLGAPRDLVLRANERGGYFERVTRFPFEHVHGDWQLNEAFHVSSATFALLTGDAALCDLRLHDAVFLDTETTGLSGGAGTYVFQVGLGRFDADGFELWQGFMAGPEDEPGLLEETSRRILASQGVVSFFGKSFDRHRLEDKMRMHAVSAPFAERLHLDLYHPLKRIFGGQFDDCRLKTLEHELNSLERPDDLPGSLAPAAWFDFLQNRAHRLEGVFRHNADDVLSLVTLAGYLGRVEHGVRGDARELRGSPFRRARAVAQAMFDAKREAEGRTWVARALEQDPEPDAARQLRLAHALSHKRSNEPKAACRELERLLEDSADRWSVPAAIEAAKLFEHALREPDRALALCERALPYCEEFHFGAEFARFKRDLEHRLRRLAARVDAE